MQIFVQLLGGRTKTLSFVEQINVSSLKQHIEDYEGIPAHEQRLTCANRELNNENEILNGDLCFVSLSLRVVGGKGGFGSLLRGAPSKIGQKKTDNFDACRDLSGRRLRHANNEKKIQEWIAAEKEREMEKVALQHIKKLANQHHFDDAKYTAESEDIKESLNSAIERGIGEAKKTGLQLSLAKKRALEESETVPQKRRQAWTDDDDLFGAESEPETKEKKSKKSKEEHPLTPPSPTASTSSAITSTSSSPSPSATTTTTTTTTTSTFTTATTTPSSSSVEQSTVTTTTSTTTTIPSSSSSSSSSSTSPSVPAISAPTPIDLSKYSTAKELEDAVGGDALKVELQRLGLLCGGTPTDRAARLFLLKTTPIEKLEKKYFQKFQKKKK